MKCKKCFKENFVKAGFVRNKQRYKCKECDCFFTDTKVPGYPPDVKLSAIRLYLEGLGFRAIERLIGISNVAVMNWVNNIAKEIEKIRKIRGDHKGMITVMEFDEMWHYVGKKNKNCGSGWLLSDLATKLLPLNSVVVVKKQVVNCGKK